jgi:hypothetical protein
MNQQVSQSDPISTTPIPDPTTQPTAVPIVSPDELVCITDRDLVVTLLWSKFTYKRKEKKSGYKTLFWFLRSEVEGMLKRWQSPEPIPVPDIRDVFQAERVFNSAVHDDF